MEKISVEIKDNPKEAPNYNNGEWTGLTIEKAVIVRNGTVNKKATIDLQLTDANGKKYVAMITKSLLKSVTDISL